MVPRLPGRCLALVARVLDRHGIGSVDALLLLSDTVQPPFLPGSGTSRGTELLVGGVHALLNAEKLPLAGLALLALEEEPGAVDGPVAEMAVTSHAQRRRRLGEELLTDVCYTGDVFWVDDVVRLGFAGGEGGCG